MLANQGPADRITVPCTQMGWFLPNYRSITVDMAFSALIYIDGGSGPLEYVADALQMTADDLEVEATSRMSLCFPHYFQFDGKIGLKAGRLSDVAYIGELSDATLGCE